MTDIRQAPIAIVHLTIPAYPEQQQNIDVRLARVDTLYVKTMENVLIQLVIQN